MSRLDILKASLEKKQAKFNRKLNEYFSDVKSANGQPLNDKRNGYSTMKHWDRQNDTLSKIQKEIEKTQTAIEREESRIRCIDQTSVWAPIRILRAGSPRFWRSSALRKSDLDFEEGQTMYIYVITMIAAALTIYFSLDEYKKGSMSTRNFKIICVCESIVLLSQLYFLLT